MVVVGLASNVDWDGALLVCFAVTPRDMEIVGAILNVFSHDHRLFCVPVPIHWVWDVNGVVMATFRVVDNVADRCVVSIIGFVCDPAEVDGTEDIVLREWVGADCKLGRSGWVGGSVFWG